MKKTLVTLSALFIILLLVHLSSCGNGIRCAGSDVDKGIITASFESYCGENLMSGMIVDNDSVFKQVFQSSCDAQTVDFSASTLLGLSVTGTCQIKVTWEVQKDEASSRYVFRASVRECGLCEKLAIHSRWVVVPKLPKGWNVSFEVE